jgi:hypothetical protein
VKPSNIVKNASAKFQKINNRSDTSSGWIIMTCGVNAVPAEPENH